MKKVLNGIQSFHALGLKKQLIAVAICAGLGMSVNLAHAASPNVSPPSVKAGAPNVYEMKAMAVMVSSVVILGIHLTYAHRYVLKR